MTYVKNTWVDQNVERPRTYEVTNNQDGSITLTDSFGLVTELGTPVNATNMNHIEDGIDNHETRITILEGQGIVNPHALKSYEDAGETLTDSEGLNDVRKYAHSSFDSSKFTVVGTPIITDDGIVSETDWGNYISTSTTIDFSRRVVIKGEFEFNSKTFSSTKWVVRIGNIAGLFFRNGYMQTLINDVYSNDVSSSVYNLNEPIYFNWVINGTSSVCTLTQNNNTIATLTSTITALSSSYYINLIGADSDTSDINNGSIDLKQFSITVNGVEVFSGNKTGIDTIKPDNYTEVGTPTISADGIASGFSSSNYLTNSTVVLTNSNTIKIQGRFKTNTLQNSDASILGIYGWDANFGCNNTALYASFGGASVNSSLTLEANTEYDYILEYNNSSFALSVKKISSSNYTTTTGTASSSFSYSGFTLGNGTGGPFSGSIDLNAFKIYIDGNLVYQPCLKIPYTWSKTDSKVVNSVYRDRVSDMYNQFGYAPYYTLSDTDFTLPMGELYGMMLNQSTPHIVETYINGTSWYRVWSDGWCEQGGSLGVTAQNTPVTVTFLKPFIDTNYFITKNIGSSNNGTPMDSNVSFYDLTTTTAKTNQSDVYYYTRWYACGYIA